MKKILVLIVIFGVFSSFSLKAETTSSWYNKFYVGAGVGFFPGKFEYTHNNTKTSWEGFKANNNLNAFLGYDLFSFLALEVGYSHFLKKEYQQTNTKYTGNKLYFNSLLKYNINKHTPFLLVGLSSVTMEDKTVYATNKQEDIAYNLGFGYEYAITLNHAIGSKYTYIYMPSINTKETNASGIVVFKGKNRGYMSYNNILLYYKYSF